MYASTYPSTHLILVYFRVNCKHYYSSAVNKTIGFSLLFSEFSAGWTVSAHLGRLWKSKRSLWLLLWVVYLPNPSSPGISTLTL